MLEDVVASYLDSLTEREFDEPFLTLLRNGDFYDLHFLHGNFEFGKDFVGKRLQGGTVVQFAFQTKAGNLGLNEWRRVRGQVEEMLRNSLAHPNFDQALPRTAVLVTTGRLVGGAVLEAQEFGRYSAERFGATFEVWDRESLVELIARRPETGLGGRAEAPLLRMTAEIDQGETTESGLELFSRGWLGGNRELRAASLEAGIIANRFRQHNRLDLACMATLAVLRAAWASGHGAEPPLAISEEVASLARSLFRNYAMDLWHRCSDEVLDPLTLVRMHPGELGFVTYPVRCMRILEILGLLGLLLAAEEPELSQRIADFICRFLEAHPGAARPISDRWAVSLIPPALLVASTCREAIDGWLQRVAKWVCDRYEDLGAGLAGAEADPRREVDYLLGFPLEHVDVPRHPESYVAAVVLDLAAILELANTYELALNDFLAVGALPSLVVADDTPAQYVREGPGLAREVNVPYVEPWNPEVQWRVAPHHARGATVPYLERLGHAWDQIALGSVLRDRHSVGTMRRIAAE